MRFCGRSQEKCPKYQLMILTLTCGAETIVEGTFWVFMQNNLVVFSFF